MAEKIVLLSCGVFFLTGLLTGVWKYLAITRSPEAESPGYVTVAHRAALMYSFAALVLLKFVELSPYPETVNLIATAVPIFFFAAAIAAYILHGVIGDTDNQFHKPYQIGTLHIPPLIFHLLNGILITGEVGGFLVLFIGVFQTLITNWR